MSGPRDSGLGHPEWRGGNEFSVFAAGDAWSIQASRKPSS